jgi:hypothetical protein
MDWPTKIEVHKDLVPLLSQQTYTDFYEVLREFINNSYDADATQVDISYNLNEQYFKIEDNGIGMGPSQFVESFLMIASTKKKPGIKTKLERSIIGQFGVGFLSAAKFCNKLIIESSVMNSEKTFEAVVDYKKFFKSEDKKTIRIGDIPVNGRDFNRPSNFNKQYTKVTLKGLSEETMKLFKHRKKKDYPKNDIKGWPGADSLKWQLKQILPLEYPKESEKYSQYLDYDWGSPMQVFLNGEKIIRNVLPGEVVDYSKEIKKIGNIKFKYAILTPWEPVHPFQVGGLQIRLNNVGIGLPYFFDLSTRTGRFYLATKWICGEIQIIEGLTDELKLSRTDFSESKDYSDFYDFFREKIIKISNDLEKRRPKKQKSRRLGKRVLKNQEKLINRETVDVDLKQVLSAKKSPISLEEELEESLGDGVYELESEEYSGDIKQKPFVIDTKKKKAKIVKSHPAFQEHLFIDNRDFIIEYGDIGSLDDDMDIDIAEIDLKKNKIILNKNFKLFYDKNEGPLYKKIFSMIEYLNKKYPKNREAQNFLKKMIIRMYFEE